MFDENQKGSILPDEARVLEAVENEIRSLKIATEHEAREVLLRGEILRLKQEMMGWMALYVKAKREQSAERAKSISTLFGMAQPAKDEPVN
jgi:hypothetical protein